MTEQIEQYMRTLKLGGLAKEWRSGSYCDDPEQYVKELLELELREREANRINRMVKTAGFQVIKTLEDFVWNRNIELPSGLTQEYMVELDREKIREAEALDGYYIIRSNVIGRDDGEKPWEGEYRFRRDNLFQLNKDVDAMTIIDMYRGLWEIEETFKITKSFLSTRPIYVRKESSIRAHFTTCFIALLIVRLLERQTGNRLNHSEVLDAVRQTIVAEISPGVYRNIVTSRNMEIIGNSMCMDLTKLLYTANEIRALSAKPKN